MNGRFDDTYVTWNVQEFNKEDNSKTEVDFSRGNATDSKILGWYFIVINTYNCNTTQEKDGTSPWRWRP